MSRNYENEHSWPTENYKRPEIRNEEKLQKQLEQSNSIIREAVEYIYKNSIPIALTVNPPIHKVNFEGDINEVLKILEVENKWTIKNYILKNT